MTGETELKRLLKHMEPVVNEGEYVFCTINSLDQLGHQQAVSTFREKEGWTVILPRASAELKGLAYGFIASWISLNVHSSLEAVGLTAAFSKALADEGISCNVVAGFYHDHLFVPVQQAAKAMAVLKDLSKGQC